MGFRYSNEAVQRCQELYLHFNGGQHDRIETEMRKQWPGWSKNNLYDRGRGKNRKEGWISLYSWEGVLRLKIATSAEGAGTSAELLFLEIETMRRLLNKEIAAKGFAATLKENSSLITKHAEYCKLSTDALARLEAARDNLAGFAKFYNDLLECLPGISEKALRELLKVSEPIMDWARTKYANSSKK